MASVQAANESHLSVRSLKTAEGGTVGRIIRVPFDVASLSGGSMSNQTVTIATLPSNYIYGIWGVRVITAASCTNQEEASISLQTLNPSGTIGFLTGFDSFGTAGETLKWPAAHGFVEATGTSVVSLTMAVNSSPSGTLTDSSLTSGAFEFLIEAYQIGDDHRDRTEGTGSRME